MRALLLGALVLPTVLGVAAPGGAPEQDSDRERAAAWIALVEAHEPGTFDDPAREIGDRWSANHLRAVLKGLPDAFAASTRDDAARNGILLKGALLHASIAILAPELASRMHSLSGSGSDVLLARDGRGVAIGRVTAHWQFGRLLLDRVRPSPSDDARVRLWYRATGAYLSWRDQMAAAVPHLAHARRIFPDDPVILLYSGALHESFGSPKLARMVEMLRTRPLPRAAGGRADLPLDSSEGEVWERILGLAGGIRSKPAQSPYGSQAQELEAAHKDFRRALGVDPGFVEARVRLGRVLSLRGRHEEARQELAASLESAREGVVRYYALMLLGREEEVLGRREAAKACFDEAALLYPKAQSPLLALSALARGAGDRAGAGEALRRLSALSAEADKQQDPWWDYYTAPGRNDKTLLLQVVREVKRQ